LSKVKRRRTDHASRDVWGNVEGVVGLPEWRNGIKLVPTEWLSGG
jgi:hypothetical protein